MCPSLTFAHLPDIVNILKRKFEDVADFKLTDKVWTQVCLPVKAHGCGIGKPEDTIAAAFVAHVEETIGAVKSRIDAPYLEFFDLRFEIPPDYLFPSRSVEVVVKEYRRLKQKIIDVTVKIGDSVDEQRVEEIKSKKKLQHYYFSLLSKYSVVQYEEDIKLHGNTHDKARTLSNNGSFAGAWLHSVPMKNESQMDNLTFRHALKLDFAPLCHLISHETASLLASAYRSDKNLDINLKHKATCCRKSMRTSEKYCTTDWTGNTCLVGSNFLMVFLTISTRRTNRMKMFWKRLH